MATSNGRPRLIMLVSRVLMSSSRYVPLVGAAKIALELGFRPVVQEGAQPVFTELRAVARALRLFDIAEDELLFNLLDREEIKKIAEAIEYINISMVFRVDYFRLLIDAGDKLAKTCTDTQLYVLYSSGYREVMRMAKVLGFEEFTNMIRRIREFVTRCRVAAHAPAWNTIASMFDVALPIYVAIKEASLYQLSSALMLGKTMGTDVIVSSPSARWILIALQSVKEILEKQGAAQLGQEIGEGERSAVAGPEGAVKYLTPSEDS